MSTVLSSEPGKAGMPPQPGNSGSSTHEIAGRAGSGWPVLAKLVGAVLATVSAFVLCVSGLAGGWWWLPPAIGVPLLVATVLSWEDETAMSLRGSMDAVSEALERELETRLARAGVRVTEARLTHLAYAPEIAEAMLRRQQASAVIAARKKIVEGAVSMVEMALAELSSRHVVELDDERKAEMVSNLLVVLCGESNAQPVVNTGTLYA